MGAVPSSPYSMQNILALVRIQNVPCMGKGAEIASDLSTSLRLILWLFLCCKGNTGYAFSMRSCKIKLLLNYILLTVLNGVKV